MTQCFPLAVTFEQIGSQTAQDENPQFPVTYLNPATNKMVEVNAEFDSGAFISIAPVSLANILGLNLTDGPTIQLSGVGGSIILAYVHSLNIQIGTDLYQGVTVAIAPTESVPFLIGRVNFWDLASINIDNVQRQVCFTQISQGTPTGSQPGTTAPIVYGGTDLVLALGLYAVGGLAIYYLGGY
jgi:hypothetical protein